MSDPVHANGDVWTLAEDGSPVATNRRGKSYRVRPEDGALLPSDWLGDAPREVLAELDRRAGVHKCPLCGRIRGQAHPHCDGAP